MKTQPTGDEALETSNGGEVPSRRRICRWLTLYTGKIIRHEVPYTGGQADLVGVV